MDIKCGAGQPSAYSGQQVVKQTTRYTHNLINPYKTLFKNGCYIKQEYDNGCAGRCGGSFRRSD